MLSRLGGQAVRCAIRRPVAQRRLCTRNFSGSTGANGAPTAGSAPSALGGITVELDRIAPRFEVPASQITILDSPANFYSTLKVRCTLITLQIGVKLTDDSAEQNPQSPAAYIPLDVIHRQDGVRTHRHPEPGSTRQPESQSLDPDRCPARHARVP